MENVTLSMSRNDAGQLLEGIDILVDQWEATVEYLATGRIREDICIRESHSLHEAEKITSIYRGLRETVSHQMTSVR